ncbi:MAG TPA: PAS domain S-box protein [Candidatus Angelobacter sp.]|jgi:PAS domain S-box-containing protein|nr:PAS domain S-box protein [Candidatus Angelobacter sp.]
MGSRPITESPEQKPYPVWDAGKPISPADAETLLLDLAAVFLNNSFDQSSNGHDRKEVPAEQLPNVGAIYRALVEQIPAVVFMAHLDRGIGEAYVSPQIETTLGFSQEEWLEDPIRWYQQIHPDDKQRWSLEAAQMFLSGTSLRSAYRVIARDGKVVWFHCEAKMIRRKDGRPWFIHGIAFDITDLKRTEEALQEERNVVSAILHTVGALIVVLDSQGRIIRFNRACEEVSGYSLAEVEGKYFWNLCIVPEEAQRFKVIVEQLRAENNAKDYETSWVARDGTRRLIAWSSTILPGEGGTPAYIIATGIDITERKRLEKAILEITAEEQRRIGQDLHDGLGQHLTGIAFMSKVQQQKLREKGLAEAADADRIVKLVNEAINKTRELAHGLHPVVSDAQGLMGALKRWAAEVEDLFGISCRFRCDQPVLIRDTNVSTHLYRIAQEAVNNAIKHGKSQDITISLTTNDEFGTLSIEDDGPGLPETTPNQSGMGLQIMNYRARMIGGSLKIESNATRGATVTCVFPTEKDKDQG